MRVCRPDTCGTRAVSNEVQHGSVEGGTPHTKLRPQVSLLPHHAGSTRQLKYFCCCGCRVVVSNGGMGGRGGIGWIVRPGRGLRLAESNPDGSRIKKARPALKWGGLASPCGLERDATANSPTPLRGAFVSICMLWRGISVRGGCGRREEHESRSEHRRCRRPARPSNASRRVRGGRGRADRGRERDGGPHHLGCGAPARR